jgi:hypothetical protein
VKTEVVGRVEVSPDVLKGTRVRRDGLVRGAIALTLAAVAIALGFTLTSGSRPVTSTTPPPLFYPFMTNSGPGNHLLLLGGEKQANNTLSVNYSTWQWTGVRWESFSMTLPSDTEAETVAYDVATKQWIMVSLTKTYVWNNHKWVGVSGSSGLDLVSFMPGISYDTTRRQLMALEVSEDGSLSTVAWTGSKWEGTNSKWLGRNPEAGHLAYDSSDGTLLFFGYAKGLSSRQSGTASADDTIVATLEKDGNWRELRTSSTITPPSPHGNISTMAYDANTKQVVLYEYLSNLHKGQTWIWSGRWKLGSNSSGDPPPRIFEAMGFDGSTGDLLLFGGSNPKSGGLYGDTWEWTGRNWKKAT